MGNPLINGLSEAVTYIIGLSVFFIAGMSCGGAIYYLTPLNWTFSFLLGLVAGGGIIRFVVGYFEARGAEKAKGSAK